MKRVHWSDEARQDLYDIADFLDRTDPDIAPAIVRAAVAATRLLALHPLIGQQVATRPLYRKRRIARTPYLLIYRPDGETLRIVRLVHAARDWPTLL